jgi:hypothetical protein
MKQYKFIAFIAATLLLSLLLPLLVSCDKTDYATSSSTIPDGWEVVSTDGNITHLRLKEGSDAYHWMDCGWQLREANTNLPLDVQIVGNEAKKPISPDKDGNVYFIVYYGRFYAEKIDGKYQIVDAPEEDIQSPMTLHMESGGEDIIGNLSGTSLFPEPWSLDEFVEYNDVLFEPLEKVNPYDPEARVGLKRAVLIACPYNKLDTGWETLIFRTQQRDGSSGDYSEEDYLSYATQNNVIYFEKEDLAETEFTLLTDVRVYLITVLVILLCSFAIMLVSAIRRKNCLLHFIPLLIGWLHGYVVVLYCSALPLPSDQWVHGVDVLAILMAFVYLFFGILFVVIRWIIDVIRRRAAKK